MPFQRVDALIILADALSYLGRNNESLKVIDECESILGTLKQEPFTKIAKRESLLIHRKGEISWTRGNLDEALMYFQQNLSLRKKMGSKRGIAEAQVNIAVVYWAKGELDLALEYSHKALVLYDEIGDKKGTAVAFNTIGAVYHTKGDLIRALPYFNRSLTLFEEVGSKQDVARLLSNIGYNYSHKGELNQALKYYETSLDLLRKIASKHEVASSLGNIGEIYRQKGDLYLALEHFKESLALLEEAGNDFYKSKTLFQLISATLDKHSSESSKEANNYLEYLKRINEKNENKVISQRCRIAEALVLKKSARIRNLAKAEGLLMEIVKEEIVDHELTVMALLNLCDLFLGELSKSDDLVNRYDILNEVEPLVDQLLDIAKQQHSHRLLAETYVLKSKLALLELKLQKAQQFLDLAQLNAEEGGLPRLAMNIFKEQAAFQETIELWQERVNSNTPIKDIIELIQLENHLKVMARQRQIDEFVLDEDYFEIVERIKKLYEK
ncbi:MAG: tetratricopeptide repeat protein [Promethearchaeota archaeon]